MDPVLRRRLEARFGERFTGPIRQRHDETEIRIGPGDVTETMRTLHDEPDFAFQLLVDLAGVDTGQIRQELECELGLVVKGGDHRHDVARADADLGLVVALADGARQLLAEAPLEAGLERSVHVRPALGPSGRSVAPASGHGDP